MTNQERERLEEDAIIEYGIVEHVFQLRPNFQVTIELPGNLTDNEVERIGKAIQTFVIE